MSNSSSVIKDLQGSESSIIYNPWIVKPLPLDWIPADKKLSTNMYIKIGERYVLLRREGDIISTARLQELRKFGTDTYYINNEDWSKVLLSMERELEYDTFKSWEENLVATRNLILAYQKEYEALQTLSREHYDKLSNLGIKFAETFIKRPELAEHILQRYTDPRQYYSNHSINVAVYSSLVGIQIGLTPSSVRDLGVASLFHNSGNLLMPADILHKKERLEVAEWKSLREHTSKGGELLDTLNAPECVVLTAKQHHECIDGTGYPNRLKLDEIHLFSRICSIADVFDALISARPHRPATLSPGKAVEKMQSMHGKFDPNLFRFISSIGK